LRLVEFEIQAHRANDAMALRRMLAAAPSSLELDVGVADGEVVVAHDVDHADASGLSFERALQLARETPVVVEAKCFPPATPQAGAFVAALRPYLARIAVCSFSEGVLAEVARLRSRAKTTLLFSEPGRIATVARTIGPRHDIVTRELVASAHAAGVRVVPWTVNDVPTIAALVDLGVDGLVTDEPLLVREVVASRLPVAA
jgi:glycerophosphoryl diester phosphodiesterase